MIPSLRNAGGQPPPREIGYSAPKVDHNSELITVDPSLNAPGVAVFRNRTLMASAVLPQKHPTTMDIGQRCAAVAASILVYLDDKVSKPRTLAIEWPQIYTAVKSKGDPNDLLGVAGVGIAIASMLSQACYQDGRGWCLEIRSISPGTWSGQLPKFTEARRVLESPRTHRILSRLSEAEKQVAALKHDALDAIGLGLFVLDRFGPKRVFPGAT